MDEPEASQKFLSLVREMLHRPDYLLPLAAAQRQFRASNYQMGSASLLEDLFFDALGSYVLENYPRMGIERRQGKETWDYRVFNQDYSHKECLVPSFTISWEPGALDEDGKRIPRWESFDYPCPIVLIYSGSEGPAVWHCHPEATLDSISGRAEPLSAFALKERKRVKDGSPLLLVKPSTEGLEVSGYLEPNRWPKMTFQELWSFIGGAHSMSKDLWVDYPYKSGTKGFQESLLKTSEDGSVHLQFDRERLPSGLYLLQTSNLKNLPLVANNKAHFTTHERTTAEMRRAITQERYVPMPLWFTYFADTTPPNLYSIQRREYEAMFAARES